jgi:hypothetical protein
MKLYNVEDSAQKNLTDSGQKDEYEYDEKLSKKQTRSFEGFKV